MNLKLPFLELNNKVQESALCIKSDQVFSISGGVDLSFSGSQWIDLPKNLQTMKYDSLFDPMVLLSWLVLCFNSFVGSFNGAGGADHC